MTLLLLHVRVARSTWHTVCKAGHLNGYTRGYIVHFQVRVVWEMAGVSGPSAGDARYGHLHDNRQPCHGHPRGECHRQPGRQFSERLLFVLFNFSFAGACLATSD